MRAWFAPALVAGCVLFSPMTPASADSAAIDYTCRIAGKGGVVLTAGTDDVVITVDLRAPSRAEVDERVSFTGSMSVALGERVRRPLRLTTSTVRLVADPVRMTVTTEKVVRQSPVAWKSEDASTANGPLTLSGPVALAAVSSQPGTLSVAMPGVLEIQATGSGLLGATRFSLTCTAADDAATTVASVTIAAKPVEPTPALPASLSSGGSNVLPAQVSAPVPEEIPRATQAVTVSLSESRTPAATRRDVTTAAAVLVTLALAYAAWCELRLRGLRSRAR